MMALFSATVLAASLAPGIAFAPSRTFLPSLARRAAAAPTMEYERRGSKVGHALIVQNKGGGHGEIGYHLAKALRAKELDVTILQDSAVAGALEKPDALPFSKYEADLVEGLGVNLVFADLAKFGPQYPRDNFNAAVKAVEWDEALQGRILRSRSAENFTTYPAITHIFDNRAKDAKDMIDLDFQLYAYVSSAGMYEKSGKLSEGCAVDPESKQRAVEEALTRIFAPKRKKHAKWCSFRPQYIYGPHTNKRDYLDWFLNRAVRGVPLVVPGNGSQPVCVTHVEDVADQLASVVGKESIAGNNCFNCGTDKLVTYEAICEAAGDAVGRNVDVQTGPIGEKSSFPFRPTVDGFANEVEKLKWALKWEDPKHDVLDDIKTWYKDDFIELGLDQGELDTSKDLKPAPEDVDA